MLLRNSKKLAKLRSRTCQITHVSDHGYEALTGTLRKASSISDAVKPFLSRKERRNFTGEPLTFGCERKLTAFATWSSLIGAGGGRNAFASPASVETEIAGTCPASVDSTAGTTRDSL